MVLTLIRITLFLAASLLAACLPVTSKTPVGSTAGFRTDPSLLGTWKAQVPAGPPAYLHILGGEDGTMTAILVNPPHAEDLGDWTTYTLRAVTLGANHLLNAQETLTNGEASDGPLAEEHVVLLCLEKGTNQITLYQMDDQAVAAAIRAGEIAGVAEPGKEGDVRITAGEPALDAFMKTSRAAKLFSKELVTLTRVR